MLGIRWRGHQAGKSGRGICDLALVRFLGNSTKYIFLKQNAEMEDYMLSSSLEKSKPRDYVSCGEETSAETN